MEFLWALFCDEQIVFVSPNIEDCVKYQNAFYENTGEDTEIKQFYYKKKLQWYLEE